MRDRYFTMVKLSDLSTTSGQVSHIPSFPMGILSDCLNF